MSKTIAGAVALSRPLPVFTPGLQRSHSVVSFSEQCLAACVDATWICFAAIAAGTLYHWAALAGVGSLSQYAATGAVVAALFVPFGLVCGAYNTSRRAEFGILQALAVWIGVFLFLAAVSFAFKISAELSRGAVLSFASLGMVGLIARRLAWARFAHKAKALFPAAGRKVILLGGTSAVAAAEAPKLAAEAGLSVLREFSWNSMEEAAKVINEAVSYLRGSDADEVLVFSTWETWPQDLSVLGQLRAVPLPVTLVPDAFTAELVSRPVRPLSSCVSVEVQRAPLSRVERAYKRAVDIVGASLGLLLLLPVLAIAALLIRLDSGGPVLFRQTRLGFNGRQFKIYKFQSMTVQEDGPVVVQASCNDSRVTRVGKLLRRSSIDELPQLLNVLQGSMSLVGPRPHAVAHDSHYSQLIGNYAYRHHVKPGLTGWAQVHGFRGETRNVDTMAARVEHDLWYIDNWSPLLDFRILAATIFEVFRGQSTAY